MRCHVVSAGQKANPPLLLGTLSSGLLPLQLYEHEGELSGFPYHYQVVRDSFPKPFQLHPAKRSLERSAQLIGEMGELHYAVAF